MHSSGLLMPPSMDAINGGPDTRSNEQKELWERSVGGIERVLPGFVREAMPPAQSVPALASAPSAAATGAEGGEKARDESGKSAEETKSTAA
jgi:brefeldin A-resistance guanine nucleotide exchange factor 1